MSKNNVLTRKQQYSVVILTSVLSLLVVWGAVSGATTISTNISTGGTLTVSDVSTLTGLSTHTGGAILVASSTAVGSFAVNGSLNASTTAFIGSTLAVTGASTLTGNVSAAGTLGVTGLTTHTGGEILVASSTAVSDFNVSGTLLATSKIVASSTGSTLVGIGVATSTPVAEFAASGNATTTIYLHAPKAETGGCIQLEGANGTMYRMYVTAGDAAAGGLGTTTSRAGQTNIIAVWEAGACK